MVRSTIVIIKGSRSDRKFCESLVSFLKSNGIDSIQRTASAHRTPLHLQRIIEEYDRLEEISAFITVAGLSDALSGTVAANTTKMVIAFPPDLEKYGESKVFSSTKLPSGLKVLLAKGSEEIISLLRKLQVHSIQKTNKMEEG